MAGYDDMANLINMAGANIIGAANAAMSYGTHKADRKFNAKQAEIARDWQLQMWNRANEYNSPTAMMQRLTEAGLNPNLVYGNGADTTAAAVPSTEKASYSGNIVPKLDNMALMTQAKQMELLDAQIERTHAETSLTSEKATTQGIVNQHEDERLTALVKNLSLDAEFNEATFNNRVGLSHLELSNATIDNYVKELNKLYLPETLELNLRKSYQELNNLVASEKLTWEQIKNISTQTWFIGQQVQVLRSEVVRNLAAANASNASANASNAQAGYYGAMTQTENESRQAKVQATWSSGELSHQQAMRISQMTDAEVAKLVSDVNYNYLRGNMEYLKTVSNRFGTGIVGSVLNGFYNLKEQSNFNEYYNSNPWKPITNHPVAGY